MDAQADAEAMTVSELALPEAIAQARYWSSAADVSRFIECRRMLCAYGDAVGDQCGTYATWCSVMTQSADFGRGGCVLCQRFCPRGRSCTS